MADIEINNARTVQDVDYITGTLANGDLVKIKKSDLAELMRSGIGNVTPLKSGLTNNGDFFYKGLAKGRSSTLVSGIYGIYQSSVENVPIAYGVIVVFGTISEYYNFWIATDSLGNVMYLGAGDSMKKILLQ